MIYNSPAWHGEVWYLSSYSYSSRTCRTLSLIYSCQQRRIRRTILVLMVIVVLVIHCGLRRQAIMTVTTARRRRRRRYCICHF